MSQPPPNRRCTAKTAAGPKKSDYLNKAFQTAQRAAEFYPGSGRLQIKLAKIAEQLDETDTAVKHYQKAIDIEDRNQSWLKPQDFGNEVAVYIHRSEK